LLQVTAASVLLKKVLVVFKALTVGKSFAEVLPVMYAFPDESTAISEALVEPLLAPFR
jgi:hypothetical protein